MSRTTETMLEPVTLKGVSLLNKGKRRRRGNDTFDLVLSFDGVQMQRTGETGGRISPRCVPWEHITEWEMEPRPGGLRVVLRDGGSATPLYVPGWHVGALDGVLAEMTMPSRHHKRGHRRRRKDGPHLRPFVVAASLSVLAVAVSLVLAQSAGAIHLGFLGPVG